MSAAGPSSHAGKAKEPTKEAVTQPALGILEEDDEFEEFPVADLAHLSGTKPGAAKSGGDKLWEDNWDDDDIEDDFSVQLRNELSKKAKSSASGLMQH